MRGSRVAGRIATLLLALLCAQFVTQCSRFPAPGSPEQGGAVTADAGVTLPTLTPGTAAPDYWRDVRPVLDKRCVVCHACFDAPCQLNLTAFEGVERGANHDEIVYAAVRLKPADPTRLFIDATNTAGWRAKGFYSVLDNSPPVSPEAARAGLMLRMLALKKQHPQPVTMPLGAGFDIGIDRKQQCPAPDDFGRFAERFSLWGMPYGLPDLSDGEYATLTGWLLRGAPYREPPPVDAAALKRVADWETFLNGTTLKQRLMSRYLYEHLFLAHFYFTNGDTRQYFRFVRSRTPPGQPVDVIATRRPFDDPGTDTFWYRLEPIHATIVAKTHMPYPLNAAKMRRFQQLFLKPDFQVTQLPGYAQEVAGNPFVAFEALPVDSRYRFMLDDAEYFIQGFMKGPVCRGQVAVDVIEDRFWVVFANPDSPLTERSGSLLASESDNLRLPDEGSTSPLGLLSWRKYKDMQKNYLKAKQAALQNMPATTKIDLDLIWDGDGKNSNAALTIFRHNDNASVVRGLFGTPPKTAWVIGYTLFERIHYLLVAGFDVYGTTAEQLDTRLYMDFMRMEGEFNFIALLPEVSRQKVRDYWYRDADDSVREYVYGSRISLDRDTDINYTTGDPRVELMKMLRQKLKPVLDTRHDLAGEADPKLRQNLQQLAAASGNAIAWLPEASFLSVVPSPRAAADAGGVFSLIKDTAHSNVASLFREGKRLIPAENQLSVARGFVGQYPNAFFQVTRQDLPAFSAAVAGLQSDADYRALVARFGIERTSASFWPNSDALARAYTKLEPVDAGIFDFGRLENR
jgi:hypothetical protein